MNQPVLLQRLEGAVIFLGSVYIYYLRDGNWWVFLLVFLAIDLSMAGYLVNNKYGAWFYNLGHTYVVPALIYVCARATDSNTLTIISLIWFAHISLDRALGLGFKLNDFRHTHLGIIGKSNKD